MYGMKSSSATAGLPAGFRFHPTDEELIIHYLKQKVSPSSSHLISIIADVNIYKFNPWELPDKAYFGENDWFFFSPRDKKYPNGRRPNRAAASGYWKATGTDKPIIASVGSQCLGMKKDLVFYIGRPSKGVKSDWTMTEYRLLDDYFLSRRPEGSMRLDDWVLCRVRQRSKGPLQTGGRNCDSSSSCSPPFSRGYLQGQETIIDQLPAPADDQYHQMAPMESEELMEEKGFQELGSPENSLSTDDLTSNSQTTTVDSNVRFGDVLKSIERVLSVGALDELYCQSSHPHPQPEEILKTVSTSSNSGYDDASIFQISSQSSNLYYPPSM